MITLFSRYNSDTKVTKDTSSSSSVNEKDTFSPNQPARRQSLADLKHIRGLNEQMNTLRLSNLEKDQRIASMNRELQERDRMITMLRRRQEFSEQVDRTKQHAKPIKYSETTREQETKKIHMTSRPIMCTNSMTLTSASLRNQLAKRPATPFVNYCSVNRGVIKMQNSQLSAANVTRVLADNWRKLTPAEQSQYV